MPNLVNMLSKQLQEHCSDAQPILQADLPSAGRLSQTLGPMKKYPFRTAQFGALRHKYWRVISGSRENMRGLIRGAVIRERGLIPSPTRAIVRRRRFRLLAIYQRIFGSDRFHSENSIHRIRQIIRQKWLSRGYAYWRDRI